jgi:hypothetical protein
MALPASASQQTLTPAPKNYLQKYTHALFMGVLQGVSEKYMYRTFSWLGSQIENECNDI